MYSQYACCSASLAGMACGGRFVADPSLYDEQSAPFVVCESGTFMSSGWLLRTGATPSTMSIPFTLPNSIGRVGMLSTALSVNTPLKQGRLCSRQEHMCTPAYADDTIVLEKRFLLSCERGDVGGVRHYLQKVRAHAHSHCVDGRWRRRTLASTSIALIRSVDRHC
jgi:hypothetical protein